jgi:hypothetical protein
VITYGSPHVARLVIVCLAFFAVLSVAVIVAAQGGQTSFRSFAEFDGCAMPCWDGIEPGVTEQSAALARIDAMMGFSALQVRCTLRSLVYCVRYTWMPQDVTARAAEMQFIPGQTEMVVVYNPGFTIGEALLTLDRLQVGFYGASDGFVANHRFHIQLLFADSRLAFRAIAACPGSFLSLVHAPVRSVEVRSSPITTAPPISTFAALRRSFIHLCGVPE